MSDLLNTLGKKPTSADGAGKQSAPQPTQASASASPEHGRGDDLLARLGSKEPQGNPADIPAVSAGSTEPQTITSKEEPAGNHADDWSKDTALKEVKKLREENKAYRIKYQQEVEKLKMESDARLDSRKEELESLKQAKNELDKIKAEQEDKKRDLTEKIAHREAKLAEMQAILDAKESEWTRKLSEQESVVRQYKAEREAEAQVYQDKVDEELSKIPAKFQDYAKLLAKGAGDSKEALIVLSEAKIKGMFDEKSIFVNHSVPGVSDGARANKDRLEDAEKARREKMSSSQKIGEALKQIKSGTSNSVFRTK